MQPIAASFVAAFQASVQNALKNFEQEVFDHTGMRELVSAGCKPDHLAALSQIFADTPHLAKILLRHDQTRGSVAEYLVGIAWNDLKYGIKAQQRLRIQEAAKEHAKPLEFSDGEATSLDPVREAAANPVFQAEAKQLLESLPALVEHWALEDAANDSLKNKPKRLEAYRHLLGGLLDGTVTRTTTGRFTTQIKQKDLAAELGSNEVYVRRWLNDFRERLDHWEVS